MVQSVDRARLCLVGFSALFCCLTSTTASAQVPANYQGPLLFGVCAYVEGDTSYYSNVLNLSAYYKLKAQEQFRQYALAQAKGTPLKGSACRWSTSKEEITTEKASDKQLLGTASHSAKGVETGWTFNAALADAAGTQPARTASANGLAGARSTGTTAQTTSNSANQASTSTGTTTPASNSVTGNAQQSASGALSGAKSTATSSMNDAVSSSVTSLSTGASGAISNLFHKSAGKPKGADASASPTGTQVATSQAATPLGFDNTESPLAATAEARQIEGLVADVANNDLVINVGVQAGVKVGMKLMVMHPVRTVKDPATGKVLRTVQNKVGDLLITSADAGSAAGTFSGTTAAQVGDTVQTATH